MSSITFPRNALTMTKITTTKKIMMMKTMTTRMTTMTTIAEMIIENMIATITGAIIVVIIVVITIAQTIAVITEEEAEVVVGGPLQITSLDTVLLL